MSYGCTFAGNPDAASAAVATPNAEDELKTADRAANYLLTSWLISAGTRFLINEPIVILLTVFMPICFAHEHIDNCCGEASANACGVLVDMVKEIIKSIRQ